ncbi:MAG: lamin tail domain-containing protein [Verrucomicrobia bacterium]|nr:lamin tail domain-containing protein [Verrucomicrobiota bacterium]
MMSWLAKISLVTVVVVCLGGVVSHAVDLRINEFMAVNDTILQDADGDYSDWIEIYNAETTSVDLAGWHLTDSAGNLSQWTFPSTNIAAGAYLVVFASGKNRAVSGEELHTDFALKALGEYLALVEPDGSTVVFEYSPAYPQQYPDISFGVGAEGTEVTLVETAAACRVQVPVDGSQDSNWFERVGFDDSGWSNGFTGVGYERGLGYEQLINTDVHDQMWSNNGTCYMRIPFVLSAPSLYDSLNLLVKYDDGFVAYLNGREIASANAPADALWNFVSTAGHADSLALIYETNRIPNAADVLQIGTNILAVHLLNETLTSSDALLMPKLVGFTTPASDPGLRRFFVTPTPGARNGTGLDDLGPAILNVAQSPELPTTDDDIFVSARIFATGSGLSTATLHYLVMFETNETAVTMVDDGAHGDGPAGDEVFGAPIPAGITNAGMMIRYYITATDTNGDLSRWPLEGDPGPHLGTVLADPAVTSALRTLHWFVEDPDWHKNDGGGNNYNWSPAYVWFDGRFYDGAQVRVRGQSSKNWRKPNFKFEFGQGHYFTYLTNETAVEEFNLQSTYSDKSYMRRFLTWETYKDAGAAYGISEVWRVQQNGEFYSVAVFLEQPDETLLERNDWDPDGALYKMFNQCTSSSSGVEKKTRIDENNADLAELVAGVNPSHSQTARAAYIFDNVDIPKTINYIAATAIIHDNDHVAKNYYVYRDTEGDGEWTFYPWDKDLTVGRNYGPGGGVLSDGIWADVDEIPGRTNVAPSHPLFGDSEHQKYDYLWNRFIDAALDTPAIREMYLRRLRTLMDELLMPSNTAPAAQYFESRIMTLYTNILPDVLEDRIEWGNPYGSNQTLEVALSLLTNEYLAVRRRHLFDTHTSTNGVGIPPAQTNSPTITFGNIEFKPATGNQEEEFIELINTNDIAVEISGWSVSNSVDFTFEPATVIPARSNLFVSPDLPSFRARSTSPKGGENRFVVGPYNGHLSARGETISLYDAEGTPVSSLSYTGDPSALQENLRITEIMYHPNDPPEGSLFTDDDFEFVEVKNISTNMLELTDAYFIEGIRHTFTNVVLQPGGIAVLVKNFTAFTNRYDTNGMTIAGVYDGAFDNDGDHVKLEDPLSETILEFSFDDDWVRTTDGGGYSLTIKEETNSFDTWGLSNSWKASSVFGGTPGFDEPALPVGSVVINEALTHTDSTQDWIEVRNTTTGAVDISGWLLSDEATQLAKYVIPNGTLISATSTLVFSESDFNNTSNPASLLPFALSELGDSIFLSSASNGIPTEYREAVEFGPSDREVTFGRYVRSDGGADFPTMLAPTRDNTNTPPKVGPLVISEVMYNPAGAGLEFIEIRNIASSNIVLYDPAHPTNTWKLTGGVDFTFPAGQIMTKGRHTLVVGTDPVQFRNIYEVPFDIAIFGPYTGVLDNAGESIKLRRPGDSETNLVPYVVVDQVDYDDVMPWPVEPDGTGPSLERIDDWSYGNDPINWRASETTPSPGTSPQRDGDGDGMPDNWEERTFFSTNAIAGGSYDDFDKDGLLNIWEYIYGSGATDSNDEFMLVIAATNGQRITTFQSREATGPGYWGMNRYYTLQESSNMMTGPWFAIPGLTNLTGDGSIIVYTNPPSELLWFNRLTVWLE